MIPVHRCDTNGGLLTGLDRIVGDTTALTRPSQLWEPYSYGNLISFDLYCQ